LKKTSITYLFFYFSFLLIIGVSIFFERTLLLVVKPIIPLSLIVIYLQSVRQRNILFLICMLLILVVDIFIYTDFVRYYDIIAVLITLFYALGSFLIKDYILKEDLQIKKLISISVAIGTLFIVYLIYSITELAMPKINDSLFSVASITISLLLFSACSFIVYKADRYEKGIYLFIATCCTLFTDALLAINELYYYTREFTVLANISEIIGLYFFTSFFVQTSLKDKTLDESDFF